MAAQSPHISCLRTTPRESLLKLPRQQLKRKPQDKMEELDVNTLMWGKFMIVTLQAAVHLGKDYLDILNATQNQPQRIVKQLFDVTGKLVREKTEIQGISVINWQESCWKRTTLLTDRAVRFSTEQANVFSESVLCIGRISENPISAWKEKIEWFMHSSQCRELDRIDGEPMEFEWEIFPGFTTLQILAEIQNMMTEIQCEPERSQDG